MLLFIMTFEPKHKVLLNNDYVRI